MRLMFYEPWRGTRLARVCEQLDATATYPMILQLTDRDGMLEVVWATKPSALRMRLAEAAWEAVDESVQVSLLGGVVHKLVKKG